MNLKEELCGPNKQQECNLRKITKIVKDRCNGTQRQNIITSEEISLTLLWEINFCWGWRSHVECCVRKERNWIAWLLAGMWKLKGIRRNADKGRCLLCVCLSEVDVKHVLLDCLETRS